MSSQTVVGRTTANDDGSVQFQSTVNLFSTISALVSYLTATDDQAMKESNTSSSAATNDVQSNVESNRISVKERALFIEQGGQKEITWMAFKKTHRCSHNQVVAPSHRISTEVKDMEEPVPIPVPVKSGEGLGTDECPGTVYRTPAPNTSTTDAYAYNFLASRVDESHKMVKQMEDKIQDLEAKLKCEQDRVKEKDMNIAKLKKDLDESVSESMAKSQRLFQTLETNSKLRKNISSEVCFSSTTPIPSSTAIGASTAQALPTTPHTHSRKTTTSAQAVVDPDCQATSDLLLSSADCSVDSSTGDVRRLRKAYDEITADCDQINADMANRFAQLQAEKERIRDELLNQVAIVECEFALRRNNFEEDLDILRTSQEQAQYELTNLRSQISELESSRRALLDRLKLLEAAELEYIEKNNFIILREQQLRDHSDEFHTLVSSCDQHREELALLREECADLSEQKHSLYKLIEEHHEKVKSLEASIAAHDTARSNASQELVKFRETMEEVETELRSKRNDLREAGREMEKLTREIEETNRTLAANLKAIEIDKESKSALDEDVQNLQKRKTELETVIKTEEERCKQFKLTSSQLEAGIAQIQSQKQALLREISTLTEERNAFSHLDKTKGQLEQRISQLYQDLKESQEREQSLKESLSSLQEKADCLSKRIEEKRNLETSLDKMVSSLLQKQQQIEGKALVLGAEVTQKHQEKDHLTAEISQINQQIEERARILRGLEEKCGEFSTLETEYGNVQRRLSESEKNCKDKEIELASLCAQLHSKNCELRTMEQEKTKLLKDIQSGESNLNECKKTLESRQSKSDKLALEIRELQAKKDLIKTAVTSLEEERQRRGVAWMAQRLRIVNEQRETESKRTATNTEVNRLAEFLSSFPARRRHATAAPTQDSSGEEACSNSSPGRDRSWQESIRKLHGVRQIQSLQNDCERLKHKPGPIIGH